MACYQSHSAGRGGRRTGRRRLRDAAAHRAIYRQSVGASSCSAGRGAGSGRRMRRASITDRPTRPTATHRKLRNGRPQTPRETPGGCSSTSSSTRPISLVSAEQCLRRCLAQSSATSYSLSHTQFTATRLPLVVTPSCHGSRANLNAKSATPTQMCSVGCVYVTPPVHCETTV